jgi:hypothetical protein
MADDAERRLTGTTQTGIGYAHTMDPPRSPRQPCDIFSAVSRRWTTRWEPAAAAASKQSSDPAALFAKLKIIHHSRCAAALNAGLPWVTILTSDIDSPLEGEVWFNAMLQLSIERRRSRMGRVKGQKKARYCVGKSKENK